MTYLCLDRSSGYDSYVQAEGYPTLSDLVRFHGVKLEIEHDPNLKSKTMDYPMDGWRYTLTLGSRSISGTYFTGIGHRKDVSRHKLPLGIGIHTPDWKVNDYWKPSVGWKELPTATDVLSALVRDADAWGQARSFDGFCSELGYAPHEDEAAYQRARAIYDACAQEYKDLHRLLGALYEAFVYAPED